MFSQIDFNKYKRFFAIGCSFTRYLWPTWADLLSKEMPNAEYYNLGRGGAGNLYISLRLAEAHSRFNLCDTDLVAIMWSTFPREDRWINGHWLTIGNVYRQENPLYTPGWIKRCADPVGYVIRDLGLMTLTNEFLKPLECTFVELFAQSIEHHLSYDPNFLIHHEINNILTLYKDTVTRIKYPLLTHMTDDSNNIKLWTNLNKTHEDSHPSPLTAYEYLMKLNFPLTKLAKEHAIKTEQLIYESDDIKSLRLDTAPAPGLL